MRHLTVSVLLYDCIGVIYLYDVCYCGITCRAILIDKLSIPMPNANLISMFHQPSFSPQILFRLGQVAPSFLAPLVSRLFLSPSEPLKSMRCALTLASAPYLFIF